MISGEAANIDDIYALAPMQQGMLFHTLFEPSSGVYVEQLIATLRGSLDLHAFRSAWEETVANHAALRTAFFWEQVDAPVQVVFRSVHLYWNFQDLQALPSQDQQWRLEELLLADRRQSFDLAVAPLMRFGVFSGGDDIVHFLWSFHHLFLDGWSVAIVLNEVFERYTAKHERRLPRVAPSPPYRDFIASLASQVTAAAETYWRGRLEGFGKATPVPLEGGAKVPTTDTFAEVEHLVANDKLDIQEILRAAQLTTSTLVHAAWALLLARYAGERDVVFGTVVAGRSPSLAGSDRMVGLFVNTLPVRIQIDPQRLVDQWLREIQQQESTSRAYEAVPLVQVQGWSEIGRDAPLFNSIVAVENYPNEFSRFDRVPGLTVSDVRSFESTNYPLTLTVEGNGPIRCRMLFDLRHFDHAAAQRLLGEFKFVLRSLLLGMRGLVSELPTLRPEDRQKLLKNWNRTDAVFSDDCGVHDLVSRQVEQTPTATALLEGDRSWSYSDVDLRANQLANLLMARGVTRGDRVGLFLERSADLMIAVLGILKAGGAYVPLDTAYPVARIAAVLKDAAVRLVISNSKIVSKLPRLDVPILRIDEERLSLDAQKDNYALNRGYPDDLAYILYTSGSTGAPKGVAMPHGALCNLITWQMRLSEMARTDRTLQFSPVGFDVSFQEIFSTWCAGGTLVLINEETRLDPDRLFALIEDMSVARLFLPFVALQQLAQVFSDNPRAINLREVITAGEQLHITPQIRRMFESLNECVLYNQYGPTETHVVTAFKLTGPPAAWPALPPIGRPIANVRAYVLDTDREPVPIGGVGELYIGGVALAEGYFNQPTLTAEQFVRDPFSDDCRLYRTGDRARWRTDGNLEFLGRLDSQIKLRGYRIEPGEIEAALLTHPAVRHAAVVARTGDTSASTQLIAYLVSTETIPDLSSDLRAHLGERVPDYMIPSAFVTLPSLPLTPSGKLDRRSLPEPQITSSSAPSAAPRTPTEEVILQIWSQVLKIRSIGIYNDFFDLGGHSLLATQVLSRLRQSFAVELPLRILFEARTIAQLALALDAARLADQGLQALPLRVVPRDQPLPLSFAQERMWFLDQLEPGSSEYNLPICLRIRGDLRPMALQTSIASIVVRHEVLRTVFRADAGRPFQAIQPHLSWPFDAIDVEEEDAALGYARGFVARGFDLSTGPLGRTLLIQLAPSDHLLVVVLHHIIADGWSLGILVRELTAFYESHTTGQSVSLAPLPLQYADFACWQRQSLEGELFQNQLDFWRNNLRDPPPPMSLPADRRRGSTSAPSGSSETLRIGPTLTAAIKRLADDSRATLFMTLLAAFQLLLHRLTGDSDIMVGTPVANRTRVELENLLGCFINPIVLRTRFSHPCSFSDLLDQVRDESLQAFANQELPFETLVKGLHSARELDRNPLFQVMFILQNAPLPPLTLQRLTMEPVDLGGGSASFDLLLTMWEADGELRGLMEYRSDLFDATTIRAVLSRYELLLAHVAADPHELISNTPILREGERQELLCNWNRTDAFTSEDCYVHDLFDARTSLTPDAVALIDGGTPITYGALKRAANQLAKWLIGHGVQPGMRVGLMLERSEALIVALLGTLKSGGVYVPLDPVYPSERLEWMANDAGVKLILTQSQLMDKARCFTAAVFSMDDIKVSVDHDDDYPNTSLNPRDLAYVLYTSGSTGRPKGVQIPHRALTNFVTWANEAYELSAADRVLQFASISFDTSVEEIYPALIRGATIVLRNDSMLGSAAVFLKHVRDWEITVLDLPTSYWHTLTREMAEKGLALAPSMRLVILGGEAARPDILAAWQEHVGRGVRLVNTYGPTEVTVVATMADLTNLSREDALTREVPIGRPIANVRAYVLAADLEPMPIGSAGELYLGGAGVASGYLNLPELTAERFIANPFDESSSTSRLYRTGDHARWRADGNLEFLGRLDHQFKLRGFRIEPAEIEAVLLTHPAVRQAAVVVRGDQSPDGRRLIAYVVLDDAPSSVTAELRPFAAARLPEFMIPSYFVSLPSLPVTPSNKLDRHALSNQAIDAPIASSYAPPETDVERTVAAIWADVLKLERVDRNDSFFDLGGHSLLAAQLLARIESQFSKPLSLRQLFELPTVAGIAAAIQAPTDSISTLPAVLRKDAVLDPSIRPANSAPAVDLASIFVTGGTGFLGTHLLAELLQTSSAVIYCLVRADNQDHARSRLQQSMERHELWEQSYSKRLMPVVGDLATPRLGLSDSDFAQLSASIDAIYHCGAGVSAVQPYTTLRAANVLGTIEILKLACHGQPKPLHHISTLAVWASPAYTGRTQITEDDDPADCEGLDGGYTQSKWAAERLVLEARARGLPVSIYRPGLVTGHSVTGICKSDDLTLAAARLCIEFKILPRLDISLDLTPVDYVARAVVHLSHKCGQAHRAYHLFNPHPMSWMQFGEWLRRQGYDLGFVWLDELEKLTARIGDDRGLLASLKLLFASDRNLQTAPHPRLDDQNIHDGLRDTAITCPPVNESLLRIYLAYFTRSGLLNASGIAPIETP